MKAFHFKLERILSLRKHREREWEIRLAEVTGRCVQLSREIEDRNRRKGETLLQMPGAGSVSGYLAIHGYMKRLEQEMEKKSAELAVAEQEREAVQEKYLEYSRERKVLDNLKEKREREYRKTQKMEEVKEIDDINTGRAARVTSSALRES